MKKIPLKDIEYDSPAIGPGGFIRTEDGTLQMCKRRMNYRAELRVMVLSNPIGQGFTVDEVRKCNQILDAIDGSVTNGALVLEDAAWQYLCRVVESAKFNMPNKVVVEMVDDVKGAQDYHPKS